MKPYTDFLVSCSQFDPRSLAAAIHKAQCSAKRQPSITHLVICNQGLPTTGAMAIVLGVGGSAWAKVELTRGVEEVWAMRRRWEDISESRGNWGLMQHPGVNPLGDEAACPFAAAAEAGRLRRRASAALQHKVFDPGRWRGR